MIGLRGGTSQQSLSEEQDAVVVVILVCIEQPFLLQSKRGKWLTWERRREEVYSIIQFLAFGYFGCDSPARNSDKTSDV